MVFIIPDDPLQGISLLDYVFFTLPRNDLIEISFNLKKVVTQSFTSYVYLMDLTTHFYVQRRWMRVSKIEIIQNPSRVGLKICLGNP